MKKIKKKLDLAKTISVVEHILSFRHLLRPSIPLISVAAMDRRKEGERNPRASFRNISNKKLIQNII